MRSRFGDLLAGHLLRTRLTQRAFADACGIAKSYPAHLLDGSRRPPVERIERMVEVLGLRGRERTDFIREACLAYLPPRARSLLESLR